MDVGHNVSAHSWRSQFVKIHLGVAVEGDAYSGFDKTELDLKLKAKKIQTVFVTGIATECAFCPSGYLLISVHREMPSDTSTTLDCVKATAVDARKNGYEVYVLDDLIAGVNVDDAIRAKNTMQEQGIHVVQSKQLLLSS